MNILINEINVFISTLTNSIAKLIMNDLTLGFSAVLQVSILFYSKYREIKLNRKVRSKYSVKIKKLIATSNSGEYILSILLFLLIFMTITIMNLSDLLLSFIYYAFMLLAGIVIFNYRKLYNKANYLLLEFLIETLPLIMIAISFSALLVKFTRSIRELNFGSLNNQLVALHTFGIMMLSVFFVFIWIIHEVKRTDVGENYLFQVIYNEGRNSVICNEMVEEKEYTTLIIYGSNGYADRYIRLNRSIINDIVAIVRTKNTVK